jgi:superfamily I DNA/RNA helicase
MFRGNDRQGLAKLEAHLKDGATVTDIVITECQRCPKPIVVAANQLMALSGVDEMVPVSEAAANIHVVTWKTPDAEAMGMAAAIVENIHAHPTERHLAVVTRRDFGYSLRKKIRELDAGLTVEIGFSEGLLESWAAREAFLLFCLLIDPDPPTWRAWLGYKNSMTGKDFTAPRRSAAAYLQILKGAKDTIMESTIETLVAEPRGKSRGAGGTAIWDRAKRFVDLRERFEWDGEDSAGFVSDLFDAKYWIGSDYDEQKVEGATLDLQLLCEKTLALLKQEQERKPENQPVQHLRQVAERLRHQIATNEALATGESSNLQVATLWGAKGVTAEHVYLLGVCKEALPGERRDEYPGTDAEYVEEQRRLFYVSITRAKKTLVISRALKVGRGTAKQIGLTVTTGSKFWADLKMSPFLHDIMALLPTAVAGDAWAGCVVE